MSTSIDRRIVSMEIENSSFQKGVDESIASLDRLDKSISKAGSGQGLTMLGSAADAVTVKIGKLDAMIQTLVSHVTGDAYNAAKRFVNSLIVEPVTTGFEKYEQKVGAVQTIMAATGKDISEVNYQLEKLNWYTDETSYNFTDMVGNIGKFTSAGMGLEDSVTAMMGIANWAAKSGVNAQGASRAMYQLSQAMGMGVLKVQDWSSIETANMGTVEFKKQCLEAAVAVGTLRKEGDKYITTMGGTVVTTEAFRDSLHEGWLTSDVMMSTFKKYGIYSEELYKIVADTTNGINTCSEAMEVLSTEGMELSASAHRAAQEAKTLTDAVVSVKEASASGWAKTFEIIFGDYKEATKLWTIVANGLYGIFVEGVNQRNEMLSAWKDLGGRNDLLNIFANLLDGLASLVKPIEEAFAEIFPPMTAERLKDFTGNLVEVTANLKLSDERAADLKDTAKGLFSVLKAGGKVIKSVWTATAPLRSLLGYLLGNVLSMTASLGRLTTKITENATVNEKLGKITTKVAEIFSIAKDYVIRFFSSFEGKEGIFDRLYPVFTNIINAIHGFIIASKDGLSGAKKYLQENLDLGVIGNTVSDAFNGAKSAVTSFVKVLDQSKDAINSGVSSIGNVLIDIAKGIKTTIIELKEWIELLFKDADLRDIVDAGYLVAVTSILTQLNKLLKELKGTVSSWKSPFAAFNTTLKGINSTLKAYQKDIKYRTLKGIAIAIVAMAGAIFLLASIPADRIKQGIGALSVIIIELMAVMVAFDKLIGKDFSAKMERGAAVMIAMSSAVFILVTALKTLTDIIGGENYKEGTIITAIGAIGFLLAALVIALNQLKASGFGVKDAIKLVALSAAVNVLAESVERLGMLPLEQIAKGILSVSGMLVSLGIFAKLLGKDGGMQLLLASAGVYALSKALSGFKDVIVQFVSLWDINDEDQMTSMALGLVTLAGLLLAVAGSMSLAGSGGLKGALGISAIILMLKELIPVCAEVNNINAAQFQKVMMTLTLSLLAISGIGALLSEFAPAIGIIAVSMLALVSTIYVFGAGIKMMAEAFETMIGVFKRLGEMNDKDFDNIIRGMRMFVQIIIEGISNIAYAMARLIPQIIVSVSEGLTASIPNLANGFLSLLIGVLNVLEEKMYTITDKAMKVINEFLRGLADNGREFSYELSRLIGEVIAGLAMYIGDLVEDLFEMLWSGITNYYRNNKTIADEHMDDAASQLMNPFAKFVYKYLVITFGPLGQKVWDLLTGGAQKFARDSADTLSENYVKGIDDGLKRQRTKVERAGEEIGEALDKGTREELGIHSASRLAKETGGYYDEGLADGVEENSPMIFSSITDMSNSIRNLTEETLGINKDGTCEFTEEIGESIATSLDTGVSTGLKTSTKAETAAKDKAQSIIDAFSAQLEAAALDITTVDLEQQLWEAMNYTLNNDEVKDAKKYASIAEKVKYQQERVNVAQQEYQKTLEVFGETAEETQTSMNKYLQEQISLYDLINEMQDLETAKTERLKEKQNNNKTLLEQQRAAAVEYAKYLNDYKEAFLAQGFTEEEIERSAREYTKYDPDAIYRLQEEMKGAVTTAAQNSMEAVVNTYEAAAKTTMAELTPNFTTVGESYSTALASGIQNESKKPVKQTEAMVTACTKTLELERGNWYNNGEMLVEGFVNGISDNIDRAARAVASMAANALAAARKELEIASPSKATYELGRYFDMGFAKAVYDYSNVAENATVSMADSSIQSFKNTLSTLQNAINSDMDLTPVITPVLNLDDIRSGAKKLGSLLPRGGLNVGDVTVRARRSVPTIQNDMPQTQAPTEAAQTINNFTQNNYSPKALTRTEIYRQTKNLFSSLKGR